jgi:CheY-like chemotaxis protein
VGTRSVTLLLVEDDPIIAMSEKMDLERFGYVVRHVLTGEGAVEAIRSDTPWIDLILMDIDLGKGIDGTEAAVRILRHRDVQIVFLSSHTEPEYLEMVEKITSYGFVQKGRSIRALDTTIRMALRLYNALQERERVQNELLETERKYRYLFENMTEEVHLWRVVRDDAGQIVSWRLVDANPVALRAWGRTRDEVIGKRPEEIWPDTDPVRLFKPIVEKVFADRSVYTWEESFPGTNQVLLMSTVSFGEYFFSVGRDISRFRTDGA